MLEWLKQRVISWFLSRHVGQWIAVKAENLHGETLSDVWTLVAKDLAIKTDCLDGFDNIPFRVRSGTVKKLTVLWKKEQSVSLLIDTVSVVLESRAQNGLSPEQKRRLEKQAKQLLLEQWEARLDDNLSPILDSCSQVAKDGEDSSNNVTYRAILDKLEVTISRIDLTYHDISGTLGAHIDTIALENHSPCIPDGDLLEHSIKSAKLSGFSLFIDAADSDALSQKSAGAGGLANTGGRNFLLEPCTASVRIGYDSPKAKFDISRPRISVRATIPEVRLKLLREQLLCVVKVADLFDDKQHHFLATKGRPAQSPRQNPKAWWLYVQMMVLNDIRDRRRRRSGAYLIERRRHRLRYVDLYRRHRAGGNDKQLAKDLEHLEDFFSFHDIVYFRCTAIKQQQKDSGQVARRRGDQKAGDKKPAWSFASWYSASATPSSQLPSADNSKGNYAHISEKQDQGGVASEHDEASRNPFAEMTSEERQALLSALDPGGSEIGATYTSLMQSQNPEQQLYTVTISLGGAQGQLVDAGKLDMRASFNDATVRVTGSVRAVAWHGELASLSVFDVLRHKPLCKHHIDSPSQEGTTNSAADLLRVHVLTDRAVAPARTGVRLRVAALDVTADPVFLSSFAVFWQVQHGSRYQGAQELRSGGPAVGSNARRSESSSVFALGHDHLLSLDLDVDAPNIYICENGSTGFNGSVLMLRLGHLSVKDVPTAATCGNKYVLHVDNVGVDLLCSAEVQEDDVYCESTIPLIADTRLEATISMSSLPTSGAVPVRPLYTVHAGLPALSVRVSQDNLMDVARIVASWSERRESHVWCHAEAPLVKGWVVIKGLKSQSGWCWRWLELKPTSLQLFRDEHDSVLDEMIVLNAMQASSELHKSVWLISLRPLEPNCTRAAGLRIYSSSQHSTLLEAIWQAQNHLNPSRDWSAVVVGPDIILDTSLPDVQLVPTRYELSFHIARWQCTLVQETAVGMDSLLDVCVSNMTATVEGDDTEVETRAQVVEVNITGASKSGSGPSKILSQGEHDSFSPLFNSMPSLKAPCLPNPPLAGTCSEESPCFALHMTSTTAIAHTDCKIQMPAAFSLSLDPITVTALSQLQARVVDVWRDHGQDLAGHVSSATPQASLDHVHASSVILSPTSPTGHYYTPVHSPVSAAGDTSLLHLVLDAPSGKGSGGHGTLVLDEIDSLPSVLMSKEDNEQPGANRRVRMSTSLQAVGLHVTLLDEHCQEIMMLKMCSMDVAKDSFTDGGVFVKGTLEMLDVLDSSAPSSIYPKIMTVNNDDEASLVRVQVNLYDDKSVISGESLNLWHLHISRPQITLLWRFVSDCLQYQHTLLSASQQQDVSASAEDDSASTCPHPAQAASDVQCGHARRKPIMRGTVVKVHLDHPELIVPRNSTSNDTLYADLGRIDIERTSRHSSEKWHVSFKQAHLDTTHTSAVLGSVKIPFVHDVDGTATVQFCEASESDATPEMSVGIEVDALRGSITDSQYALIVSIFSENFTEKRVEGSNNNRLILAQRKIPMAHLEENALSDTLGNLIDLARGLNAHRVPSSTYDITIRDLELDLYRSEPGWLQSTCELDSSDVLMRWSRPLMHSIASDLCIRYEGFAARQFKDGSPSQGLDSSVVASLSEFDLFDTRVGALQKSEPLLCVRNPLGTKASGSESTTKREKITLQYFKLSQGHTGIYASLPDVDTVFDIGFLMNTISFLTAFNGPAYDDEGFGYSKTRAGGFRVQVDLADTRMQLLTRFDKADAPGFDANGSLSVIYACSASEDVLDVKLDNLTMKVRQTISHDMQVVRPCSVMASWQWYRELDPDTLETISELLQPEHKRRPTFFFAAKDLRAFVTYENIRLAMGVYYGLMDTLAASRDTACAPLSPKTDQAESDITRLQISGANIMLTLIDDFGGRWIPLIRFVLPNVHLHGNSCAMDLQLIHARLDYFHLPSSSWQNAVVGEPSRDADRHADQGADLSVRYLFGVNGGNSEVQVHIQSQDGLTVHVSRAAIDSCISALQAWSQDHRMWRAKACSEHAEGPLLSKSSSTKSLQSQIIEEADTCFVPYRVHNMMAEPLLVITEDGSEYSIDSDHSLQLSYTQVFDRRSELSKYARDCNDSEIKNMIHLQLAGARRIFGTVSIEKEVTTSFDIEPADAEAGMCALRVCAQLSCHHGEKVLRMMSMVSVRNCSSVSVACAVVPALNEPAVQLGSISANGMIGVPLRLARDGILIFKPLVPGLDYDWCDVVTEAIQLRSLHDGTFRITQMVDVKFQRIFGSMLPADTTLLHWYSCANDLPGLGLRQGALYLTERFLCHYSNVMGDSIKEVIPVTSITELKKINTALVIPNAIKITTGKRSYYFRTLVNRAETFREIVKLLSDKSIVSQEDDVDQKTRTLFNLEASDTILAMYSATWHHDPGFTEGKLLLTNRHLLFVSNDEASKSRRKISWTRVREIEKRKSFLVRNNAVYVLGDTPDNSIFLSSSKWDRDKVVEEEMSVLLRNARGLVGNNTGAASESLPCVHSDDSLRFSDTGVRCRTLTCNVVQAIKTPTSSGDASSVNAQKEYERQLQRSRDAVIFTVSVVDCKTQGKAFDRKPGNPCMVELHAPWLIENLTASNMQVQLVDKTKSVIALVDVAPAECRRVTTVDLRRELRLRMRMIKQYPGSSTEPQKRCGLWSHLVSVYSMEDGESESVLDVPNVDHGEGSQEVVAEVTQDAVSCGFRICLYNKFWILNISGLDVFAQSQPFHDGNSNSRRLPLGAPVGWSGGKGLEIQVPGYRLSTEFALTDNAEHTSTLVMAAQDGKSELGRPTETVAGMQAGSGFPSWALPFKELSLNLSTSAGLDRFDRTIVVTIAPVLLVENCLPDADIVVWQRETPALPTLGDHGPRLLLAPSETRPMYPEGTRNYCRLSVNLKEGGIHQACAMFAPEMWRRTTEDGFEDALPADSSEPILVRMSCGRLAVVSADVNRANTVILKVRDAVGHISDRILNRSHFSLDFRQVQDRQRRLLHVDAWSEEPLVWPEPTDLPHKLVLAKVNGVPVPPSAQLDLNSSGQKLFDTVALEEEVRELLSSSDAHDDLLPAPSMSSVASSSLSTGYTQAIATVVHDGKEVGSAACRNGANMWADRDGVCDKRNYRLRNVPHFLHDACLFQLPCRLLPNTAVQVSLLQPATVFAFFVPSPRDGGLPPKLLAIGWKYVNIPGVHNWFDWDGKVGNPEQDRFVVVLSKLFEAATTFILPSHAGDTLMGLAVHASASNCGKTQHVCETSPTALIEPADEENTTADRLEPRRPPPSRNTLRLHDPELLAGGLPHHDPEGAPTSPLVIPLTTASLTITGGTSASKSSSSTAPDSSVVHLQGLDSSCRCCLRRTPTGCGWLLEYNDGELVWLNNQLLRSATVLKHGDAIALGAPVESLRDALSLGPTPQAEGGTGIVYVFEDLQLIQNHCGEQAADLRATSRFNQAGCKVVHVHVGELLPSLKGARAQALAANRSIFSLKAPIVKVVLEDDIVSVKDEKLVKEEVLLLAMDDLTLIVDSEADARTVSAQVLGLQIDNEFDDATKFPVVLSVLPSQKTAINLTIVETAIIGSPLKSYEVHLGIGEAFIFLDDKLIVRIGDFLGKVLPKYRTSAEQDKHSQALSSSGQQASVLYRAAAAYPPASLPPHVNAWELLAEGIDADISALRMAVIINKTDSRADLNLESVLFVKKFMVRPITVHLTLMSTGDPGRSTRGRSGGAAVVRKYAGAVLERMIRQVRIDDVVVNVPAQNLMELRITQAGIVTLISNILLGSLKKSFFTAKFMLKGLDAWSDSLLGLETEGQMAGERRLTRIPRRVPLAKEYVFLDEDSLSGFSDVLPDSSMRAASFSGAVSSRRVTDIGVNLSGRALSTIVSVPQFAGGMVKKTIKKGASVAGAAAKGVSARLREDLKTF